MTQDEADKIAAIIATADSGCPSCVDDLCERLNEAGLGFSWAMIQQGGAMLVTAAPAEPAPKPPATPA